MSALLSALLRSCCRLPAVGGLVLAVGEAVAAAPVARVVDVAGGRVADLVVIGAGLEAGFRAGMVARVTRGSSAVGEVILVDLRPSVSTALILSLSPRQLIRPGDVTTIKLFKS